MGNRYTGTVGLICLGILLSCHLQAQIGGDRVFSFLHLSPSARLTGLGSIHPAVMDDDPAFAWQNPAVLNPRTHQALSFNHSFFPAGIQHSTAMYSHSLKDSSWHFGLGVQYLDYGDFDLTNEQNTELGEFTAGDLALMLTASRQIHKNYFVGANVKYVNSQLESYSASAILLDLSAHYYNEDRRLNVSLTAKNLGFFTRRYDVESDFQEMLPFDLVLGFSKRLEHLPFRYGISFHHLYRWNVLYDDPNRENNTLFGEDPAGDDGPGWVDNFFRHINFNGEFLLGKRENFRLRIAYSHMLRQELKLETAQSLAGFSFGFGMKISRFRIDYGRSVYHLAGGVHHLSIGTRISEFL